jgi:hypothetical protein
MLSTPKKALKQIAVADSSIGKWKRQFSSQALRLGESA